MDVRKGREILPFDSLTGGIRAEALRYLLPAVVDMTEVCSSGNFSLLSAANGVAYRTGKIFASDTWRAQKTSAPYTLIPTIRAGARLPLHGEFFYVGVGLAPTQSPLPTRYDICIQTNVDSSFPY